jgi:hypothetical protein
MTGTTKNKVIKFIPLFSVNCASVPQLLHRIISGVFPEPHAKNFVPIIKNIITKV